MGHRLDPNESLLEVGRIVLSETPLEDVLRRVAELAKATIPGVEEASMTFSRGGAGWTMTSTGPLATELDELQYAVGGGPCMDAGTGGEVILIRDFRTDERFPDYAPKALSTGVGSSLSVPIPMQGNVLAAVNLYSVEVDAFDGVAIALAQTFASHAGVAILNAHEYATAAEEAANLRMAMESRATIEQAKGILMAQSRCSPQRAFDILVAASQRENRKLRDIASDIVERAQRPQPEVDLTGPPAGRTPSPDDAG